MIRLSFKFLGFVVLSLGFVAFVIDGTRTIAGGKISVTTMEETLNSLAGQKLVLFQAMVERNLHPFIWKPVLTTLLLVPTFVFAMLIGYGIIRMARERVQKIGYTSRP